MTLPLSAPTSPRQAIVIGAGPAGLMAANALCDAGHRVDVYDAMPTAGRKFLLAGIGGLNLTHSEAFEPFVSRYREAADWLRPLLAQFDGPRTRAWAAELGIETFVGSSGRVFPREMKAAPLLRAWLQHLRQRGVVLHMRHHWQGWQADDAPTTVRLLGPEGELCRQADVVVLALGGGSYARLGSDGAWLSHLHTRSVGCAALLPANCGFELEHGWSAYFRERFRGHPLKNVVLHYTDGDGVAHQQTGECMISETGLEGGLIYAHSAALRSLIEHDGSARITLDLAPGRSLERLQQDLSRPRGKRSLSSHLQGQAGLEGAKAALLRESVSDAAPEVAAVMASPTALAAHIKAFPVQLARPRPLEEAISSAGGVLRSELNDNLMLQRLPGVFCCGEMIDWEAPTGGYLLTACLATGLAAGRGAAAWLERRNA